MKPGIFEFEYMTEKQLREFLNGCHRDKCFDAQFEWAARIYNDKYRGIMICENLSAD